MTLREDISMDELEVGSLWKGHHTKYVYKVLAWDGNFTNGGMAFVRRAKKVDGYYEYKTVNIVDLLSAYEKLPSPPKKDHCWVNPYGGKFIVRVILEQEDGNTWVLYQEESDKGVEYTALEMMDFLQNFTREWRKTL